MIINILTGICALICAVEAFLIYRETTRLRQSSQGHQALTKAKAEIQDLKAKLMTSAVKLESAQKEVQGIYVLWNKTIESEQKMRRDLDIAKTQLTYLAQKVVRIGLQTEDSAPTSQSSSYWETPLTEAALSPENIPALRRKNTEIRSEFL